MSGDGREMQRDWIGNSALQIPSALISQTSSGFLIRVKRRFFRRFGKLPTTQLFTRNSAVILGSVIFGFLGFRLVGSDRAVHFPD